MSGTQLLLGTQHLANINVYVSSLWFLFSYIICLPEIAVPAAVLNDRVIWAMTEETAAMLSDTVFMCPSRCVAAESTVAVRLPPGIHREKPYLFTLLKHTTDLKFWNHGVTKNKHTEPEGIDFFINQSDNQFKGVQTLCQLCLLSLSECHCYWCDGEGECWDGWRDCGLLQLFQESLNMKYKKDNKIANTVTFRRRMKPAPSAASPPARPEDEPATIEESSLVT